MRDDYADIIDHPHHSSKIYPSMPMEKRAAQFMPFKAMVGYEDAVEETVRLTDAETQLSEDALEELDYRLRRLLEQSESGGSEVSITYFVPDERKDGGEYVTLHGLIRRIDAASRTLIMSDGTRIALDRVTQVTQDAQDPDRGKGA